MTATDAFQSMSKGVFVIPYESPDPEAAEEIEAGPSRIRARRQILGPFYDAAYERYLAAHEAYEAERMDEQLEDIVDWLGSCSALQQGGLQFEFNTERLPVGILQDASANLRAHLSSEVEHLVVLQGRDLVDLSAGVRGIALALLADVATSHKGRPPLDEVERWWTSLPTIRRSLILILIQDAQLVPPTVLSEIIYVLSLRPHLRIRVLLAVPSASALLASLSHVEPSAVEVEVLGLRGARKRTGGVKAILKACSDPSTGLHIGPELMEELDGEERLYGGGGTALLKSLQWRLLYHSVNSPLAVLTDDETRSDEIKALLGTIEPTAPRPDGTPTELKPQRDAQACLNPAPRVSIMHALASTSAYHDRVRITAQSQIAEPTGPGHVDTNASRPRKRRRAGSPNSTQPASSPFAEPAASPDAVGVDDRGDVKELETLFNLWRSAGRHVNLWDWLEGFRGHTMGVSSAVDAGQDDAEGGKTPNGEDQADDAEQITQPDPEGAEAAAVEDEVADEAEEEKAARLHAVFVRFCEEARNLGLLGALPRLQDVADSDSRQPTSIDLSKEVVDREIQPRPQKLHGYTMTSPRVPQSGSVPRSPRFDGGERSRPAYSSAAFLHHLHTDPSSHHVSLTAPPSVPSFPSSKVPSPKLESKPLEPRNAEPGPSSVAERPALFTRRSSIGGTTSQPKPRFVESPLPMTGPSFPALRRAGSKRGRPMTAPGGSPGEGILSSSQGDSPEMAVADRLADPPFIPAQDDGGSVEVETPVELDASFASFESCEPEGIRQAMDMLEVSEGREQSIATHVIGRSRESTRGEPEQDSSVRRLQSQPISGTGPPRTSPPDLDWKTFGQSYAHGNFDPNKIPHPPRSAQDAVSHTARSSPGSGYRPLQSIESDTSSSRASGSLAAFSQASGSSHGSNTTYASVSSAPATAASPPMSKASSSSTVPTQGGMAAALAGRQRAFELENIEPRKPEKPLRPDVMSLPSYSLAAATVRLAASGTQHSGFAPLNIPSPDRELLDPLASLISPSSSSRESVSSDPGSSRFHLGRSMSSTVVTRDREGAHLPTIAGSPAGTPLEHPTHSKSKMPAELPRRATSPPGSRLGPGGMANQRIPPATAPVEKTVEAENEDDYFGSAVSPFLDRQPSYNSQSSGSNQTVTQSATPMMHVEPAAAVRERTPSPPALPTGGELGELYEKFGWLPAPVPPDELARRKALYRFNILHTSPDVNFDRIAHMAKLVFGTKIVIIGLVDANTQWHKTESGLGAQEVARVKSLCGHTLLIKSGEPLVILDATQDWRFANNPNVTGPPHIRFYAGAPLRSSDGYNLGTLCVIDDKPRSEFPPRSRLILKEFAAVCMREMELWRDKLQLRVRDKIQLSMEKFTRECLEMDARTSATKSEAAAKMDQVYLRAAQLVCTTLDLDGCFILDLSPFELVDIDTEQGTRSVYRADPYTSADEPMTSLNDTFGPVNALPVLASTPASSETRALTSEEHKTMSDFLLHHRDGRIFENIAPSWIRYMFPADMRYGMVVPCFGVHQQPFALIAAYTCNKAKQYLEGYELQFLRAIGVIILSAVLRRRMALADQTKSVLISSVSHELRTPLHGILAAAELLSDTDLDSNQQSFLKTVQTCGNTLIETVNHVLDFTKLSGSSGSTRDGTIKLAKVNLANLVEQTVEGVWIGQRARFFMGDSDIGSFYAPPAGNLPALDRAAQIVKDLSHVETVVDIGYREKGWMVRCERGGLRRVLMNLVGNSLKFTSDGYIQITLRELPHPSGAKTIPVEMAVIDTGKGIGKSFLKDQMFRPFSQENPLQTGTGLGLAIVNSIVRSDSVKGKVDVWSSEGMGTEIRISFEVEVYDEDDDTSSSSSVSAMSATSGFGRGHSISLAGFDADHRGHVLAVEVLTSYAVSWSFDLREDADIHVINEDEDLFRAAVNDYRPIIFITSTQNQAIMQLRNAAKLRGGFVQVILKPVAPSPFRGALQQAVTWLERRDGGSTPVSERERPPMSRGDSGASAESNESNSTVSELVYRASSTKQRDRQPLLRRRSEEQEHSHTVPNRPSMAPRGVTYHNAPPPTLRKTSLSDDSESASASPQPGSPASATSHISTISLADGGVMLKTAQLPSSAPRPPRTARVMVVEDNIINRRVLGAFLKKKGFEFSEAHDGRDGVSLFDKTPPNYWDVILMDISMPVMNGHEATRAIRKIENARRTGQPAETPPILEPGQPVFVPPLRIVQSRVKIFALTGLATPDDKRQAFGSGVDGYLVKPVSLASLDVVFKKLGY